MYSGVRGAPHRKPDEAVYSIVGSYIYFTMTVQLILFKSVSL
jgi:hypothetical protein